MYRIIFKIGFIIFLFFTSCEVFKELATFTKCDFRVTTLENASLAGINIQQKTKLTDLNIIDAAKVTTSLISGRLPLSFTLNIEARNPNTSKAAISGIEWIALIDNVEILRGIHSQRVEIEPNNGISAIPIFIETDLKKILTKESKDAILNFGFNLANKSNQPTRVTLQVKPSIVVSGMQIAYPGYINLSQEFKAN